MMQENIYLYIKPMKKIYENIMVIIVGAFLLIIITFVSTLLLFPAPKSNHTESDTFNKYFKNSNHKINMLFKLLMQK